MPSGGRARDRRGLVDTIPEAVRRKALAAGAAHWLRELPELVERLERDWSISVGRSYGDATEALVAEATQADRTPVVLKLHIPRLDSPRPAAAGEREMTVLRLAGGEGCARLLRCDEARGALLLERLGRPLQELGMPLAGRLEVLCAAAMRLWRPAPGSGLPSGADQGREQASYIVRTWEELGRPCTEAAVGYALACADRRVAAHDEQRAVLLHGDVHQWNALAAGGGFKLVDPDGVLAEAEYDLGVLMREDPEELMTGDPRDRARWLAARCGLDAGAIWEWGAVQRVSCGLLLTQLGVQPVARQMLAVADRVAAL
jgi:streptomycin 6-kinase